MLNSKLSQDKQLMWDILSSNYAKLSHEWGQHLLELSKCKQKQMFHARADDCISEILSWPIEERARAVKTWLSYYQIPFDAQKLKTFSVFHKSTGAYVIANSRRLTSYD
jgi:hypothetical protein